MEKQLRMICDEEQRDIERVMREKCCSRDEAKKF
jgi:hypothetical protein